MTDHPQQAVLMLMLASQCFGQEVCTITPCPCAQDLIDAITKIERERCAKIAEAHKGTAGKRMIAGGKRIEDASEEIRLVIDSEARGEDIAAEIIATAIRNSA